MARVAKKFDRCDPLVLFYIGDYMTRKRLATLGFTQSTSELTELDIEMYALIDEEFQELVNSQLGGAKNMF